MKEIEILYLKACREYYSEREPILSDQDFDSLQRTLANDWENCTEEFKRRSIPEEFDTEWTTIANAMKTQAYVSDWNDID